MRIGVAELASHSHSPLSLPVIRRGTASLHLRYQFLRGNAHEDVAGDLRRAERELIRALPASATASLLGAEQGTLGFRRAESSDHVQRHYEEHPVAEGKHASFLHSIVVDLVQAAAFGLAAPRFVLLRELGNHVHSGELQHLGIARADRRLA